MHPIGNAAPDDPANAYGRALTQTVPNEPRPGALPVAEGWTKTPVPLSGVGTVGDLVALVARKTGHEIVADPRFGVRRLALVGTSAPAGDLLVAVAHALKATYRAVGPALLLTDDALGLGARVSAWSRWEARGKAELDHLQNAYLTAASARLRNVPKVGLDPESPTPEQIERSRRGPLETVELPVGELTDGQRAWLQAELARPENRGLYDETRATLWPETRIVVRYAGLDDSVELTDVERSIPRVPPPPASNEPADVPRRSAKEDALALSLTLDGLAESLDAAHAVGFAEVWIVAAPAELSSSRLKQALAYARSKGLAPWVALRPFATGSGGTPDLDLEGRPSGTVVPSPSTATTEATAVKNLLTTGVVLLQAAPPGYRGPVERATKDVPFGYTLPARLAFLRATGYDPIDVPLDPFPWRLRDAIDSTAFGQVYNPPAEPRRTLEKGRFDLAHRAAQAFHNAYSGPLRVEFGPDSLQNVILTWAPDSPDPLLNDYPTVSLKIAFSRIAVPPGATLAEASERLSYGGSPFCLDLSAWKRDVPATLRGLFGSGKVP